MEADPIKDAIRKAFQERMDAYAKEVEHAWACYNKEVKVNGDLRAYIEKMNKESTDKELIELKYFIHDMFKKICRLPNPEEYTVKSQLKWILECYSNTKADLELSLHQADRFHKMYLELKGTDEVRTFEQ